jgi:hypothetical protein
MQAGTSPSIQNVTNKIRSQGVLQNIPTEKRIFQLTELKKIRL